MTGLRIALLGQPHVQVDDEPLEVDTRKAVAILALVAVDGQWSRESLAAMLWPDSDPARARAALRRTLSVLQAGLGRRWLQVGRATVQLEDGPACDVTRTGVLVDEIRRHEHADEPCEPCRSRLTELVDLYRGEFMEGFTLRDSPGFDDWCTERGEHLRRRLCRALDLLGRLQLAADDLDGCAEVCQRWLQVDPLNEQVHRRLMQLHAWRGERAEAIERYRACVTVLDRELGVMPMGSTTDLYRAIIEDRLPSVPSHGAEPVFRAPPPATPEPHAPADPWTVQVDELPLVGREEPLARLLAAHGRGSERLLVVSGEAGVGKTRLAHELAARLRSQGSRVAAAQCHPGEVDLAFGPVVELLQQAVGQVPLSRLNDIEPWRLAEVSRLVPELLGPDRELPDVAPLSSPGAQARLFEAIWDVLELSLSIDGRGVVLLDDLHAVDTASLDLLGYGLRRIEDRDLTMIACLRPEEVVDEHAVRHLLDQSAIREVTCEVTIGRLADRDVDRLVETALDRDDASTVGDQIRSESEGLPLLVVEYLRLVRDTGHDGGADAMDLRQLLPHGASELARRRLGQVSEAGRQVASTAATIGRSFDLSVVLHASGRTEDEVVKGMDELTTRQIVRELPDEQQQERGDVRYDFVHDKLRQAIYERTSLARRRLLHRRVAEALAAGTRGGRDAGAAAALIGDHHRRGGQELEAAAWFRRAGDHARSLFANRDALEHYQRALGLDDAGNGDLHARVGEVRMLMGDYTGALSSLELAAARADDDDQLAGIEHQLGALHLRLGDIDAAAAHLDRAAAIGGGSSQRLVRIHADRALLAVRADDLDGAGEAASQARSHGDAVEDVEAAAQVHNVQGLVARHRGDHENAREHFARSTVLAADLPDPDAHIAAMNNLALTEADSGDLDAAITRATEAVELVARRGDRHREAALRNNLADLLHRAGREEESMAALKAAVAIFAEIGQDPDQLRPEIWKLVEW